MTATWNVRHEGSPRSVQGLTLAQIIVGLRDGLWEPTDEVMGPNDRKWVTIEAHPQLEAVASEIEPPPPPSHPDESRLDMNPLIDVCLVLLIFFILTTTYVAIQKVVPVTITTDSQKGKIQVVKPGQVQNYMIRVRARPGKTDPAEPVIKVEDEKEAGLAEFPQVLASWVNKTHKHEMLLDVAGITWGMTIRIQDAAKGAGVNKIYVLSGTK
jgi:biopolymer transport protein ExbD